METSAKICVVYSPQPRLREYLVNKVSPIHARILNFIIPPAESLEGFSSAKKFGRGCLSGITAIAAAITYLVLGLLGIAPIGLAIAGDEAVKAVIDHNNKKFAENNKKLTENAVRLLEETELLLREYRGIDPSLSEKSQEMIPEGEAESPLPERRFRALDPSKSRDVGDAVAALIRNKVESVPVEVDLRIVRRCDVPVISNQHSDSQYEARPTSPSEEPVETILARQEQQRLELEAGSSQRAQTTISMAAICNPKKLEFTENLTRYFTILAGVLEDQSREIDQRPVREIQRRESAPDILKAL